MTRFKDRAMQTVYEGARKLGADTSSEFYHQGRPRTGASHRTAYWHGRSGITDSLYARARDTVGYAFYAAGRDDRKADGRKGHFCPKPSLRTLGGPIYPEWAPAP